MGQVMIIEDSQALRKIMEVLLHREEIDTESYADGYTALRALQTPDHPVPAVVLLDLSLPPARNLPAIDGYAFAKLLRSQPRFDAVVIIVLSGHDDVVTRVRARLAGARAYLSKPFKMQQLLALIRQYLALPTEAEEKTTANCLL